MYRHIYLVHVRAYHQYCRSRGTAYCRWPLGDPWLSIERECMYLRAYCFVFKTVTALMITEMVDGRCHSMKVQKPLYSPIIYQEYIVIDESPVQGD